jgi:uncharacterized protein YndB with AHSA1/START domain
MSIAPVTCSIEVKVAPARAFDLFTSQISLWWPRGRTPGGNPHAAIVIEPRADGRWFERDADGQETQWGKVLAWEPPARLVLGWQLSAGFRYDPNLLNEVEITFEPTAGGGTRVLLEHRNLDRHGADAAFMAGKVGDGWPSRLAEFAAYADGAGED